jgi:hypothetical protein
MTAVTEGDEEVEILTQKGKRAKYCQFNSLVCNDGELQLAQYEIVTPLICWGKLSSGEKGTAFGGLKGKPSAVTELAC